MKSRFILGSFLVMAVTFLVGVSDSHGQFRRKEGGFPGGGFPGGGFPGGGSFKMGDPNSMFDMIAKGRPYFLISETTRLREPLMEFAKVRGITDGRITREHFAAYNEFSKAKYAGGNLKSFAVTPGGSGPATFAPGAPPQGFPPPGGFAPAQPVNPIEAMQQYAELDFKRHDDNGDTRLNADEAPGSLRKEFTRYDSNNDGLIDVTEYKTYFVVRMQEKMAGQGGGAGAATFNPVITLVEEDLERRPEVLRAGKLPKDKLPTWFIEYDGDSDGQVSLTEWRKGGKDLDDFAGWDRDDDGFVTPEEAMRVHLASRKDAGTTMSFGKGEGGKKSWGGFGGGEGGKKSWGGFGGGEGGEGRTFKRRD